MDYVRNFSWTIHFALVTLRLPCKRYILPGGILFRLVSAMLMACALVHCAKSESSYIRPAPKTNDDLGWIATVHPQERQRLLELAPAVELRSLNPQQNLFEVSHVSETVLRQTLADQNIYKNKFLKMTQAPDLEANSFSFASAESSFTSEDAVHAMKTCKQSNTEPFLSLETSVSAYTQTIQLGESVTLKASGTPHLLVGGELRFFWDMRPPSFSKMKFGNGIADAQTFTPDSTGLYLVGVFAQGADLSCQFQQIYFLVTQNPELSATERELAPPNTSLFKHITEVNADKVWPLTQGHDVLVAVLDSGVNYNHPALRQQISINANESVDTHDEDNDGYPDNTVGWDFANGDRFPFDDAGHGSHVAGLIASQYAGIAPQAQILPLKIFDAGGSTDLGTLVAAIYYSVNHGAHIINASLELVSSDDTDVKTPFPFPLLQALAYAQSHKVLFVAAAGNGDAKGAGFDIRRRSVYPASINLPNTISVAATSMGELTTYSNFSTELVQVAAPGGDQKQFIFSLAPENPLLLDFVPQAGTSMASPIVAGIAALMLSANPLLQPQQIKEIFLTTGKALPSLKGKITTGSLVDAEQAVKKALDLQPALM